MPLTPDPPFPKSQGDTLRSKDWNDTVNEVIRLDNAKVNRAGDHITGPLSVDGALGVGTTTPDRNISVLSAASSFLNLKASTGPIEYLLGVDSSGGILSTMTNHDLQLRTGNSTKLIVKSGGNVGIGLDAPAAPLHVADHAVVGPFASGIGSFQGRVEVSGTSAEFSFIKRTLTAYPQTPVAGDRYVWYNQDGFARLWTEVRHDLLTVDFNGNVVLTGDLMLPNTVGSTAAFTSQKLGNEGTFRANNLKLRMGTTGLIIQGTPPLQYEFAIGHVFSGLIITGGITSFVKKFSVNENGDIFAAGAKTGYVVDYFVNNVGETLEQGDVVVIGDNGQMRYSGSHGDIPVPEVDLTDKANDNRVCGVVASFVPEADLPSIDFQTAASEEEASALVANHPFKGMAAKTNDRTRIAHGQLGRMVTLGTFAHCKVDADIAPIKAGDLLTTSPTKGHAQKVVTPTKALGSIVGKALAPLPRGKGKIPVLVMLI